MLTKPKLNTEGKVMDDLLKMTDNGSAISEFTDPFKSDKVDKVFLIIYPKGALGRSSTPDIHATVSFKNGNTTGEQRIDADDFVTLVNKVRTFINGL